MAHPHGSAADRGRADAYYGRRLDPHKMVDGERVTDLTNEEREAYFRAYYDEPDRQSDNDRAP